MSTLAKSGHLFELHRSRGKIALAVRFYSCRQRQLRRAIRHQRLVIFRLRLRYLRFLLLNRLRPRLVSCQTSLITFFQ
jgi:hypothetical protein